MAEVLFFLVAAGALAGAIGTVSVPNPFYSVLALVCHLLCLALLFLLLRAEFVAAAQVVVYAGAVMVLYMFVVAYVGGSEMPVGPQGSRSMRLGSIVFAAVLFVELAIAILGTGLKALGTEGAGIGADGVARAGDSPYGTPEQIGELLLTKFLLPFEIASFLLLIAAVGAVTLARRRGGLHDGEEQRITPLDFVRPRSTGTMAEAVGTRPNATTRERAGLTSGAASGGTTETEDR
ncbi:MAG: NADH-quinone oxidoreductase subunit [Solirubrobacterales bacterium]|jgi:NADH-quinone oxidoreductase subunit J|nr:NADH-quinone oxidoreductase subunit [Solirubrobacterales bacterium]